MRYTKSKKKCVKKRRNTKRLKTRKQSGGGPLNSIMSMVPFMPKFSQSNQTSNSSASTQQQNNQNSQNVLVGALCNQFVKNNIKGSNSSTYDGVLDNLCSNQQVGITNMYNSNSMAQVEEENNVNQTAEVITKSLSTQEGGDYKEPYFLKGVKGFAKLYSTTI